MPRVSRNCRFAISGAIVALTACGGVRSGSVLVSDSSGVQITELPHALTWESQQWNLTSEPLLDIGVQQGEAPYELDRVAGAGRLADGSIVIANAGTSELRLYDSGGKHIRSMGRRGDGPGEFRRITWVQVVQPDTLLVVDSELRRVTAFTESGDVLWTTSIEGSGVAWKGDVRLADGSFVLLTETGDVWQRIRAGQAVAGRTERNTAVLAHYAQDGSLLDTLGRFSGFEEAILSRNGRPATTYAPWGRQITHGLATDRVYVGTQDAPEVRAYAPDGALVAIIRWPATDRRITDADLNRLIAIQTAFSGADSATREAIAAQTRSLPLPDARPTIGQVIVDELGLLWVSEPRVPMAPPVYWAAIDPAAGVRGQIAAPEAFEVYEIGREYILGRWVDNIGVHHVRMLRLNR